MGRARLAVHSLKDLPTELPKAWCWPRFLSVRPTRPVIGTRSTNSRMVRK